MAKVFDFSPEVFAETFKAQGYVHIPNAVTHAFLTAAREQLERCRADPSRRLAAWEIKNKKQQYLFEFPDENGYLENFFRTVATVTGLPADRMLFTERRLKVYTENAPSAAPAHKDRLASQVAVGIPLRMPEASRLILYPDHCRATNPFETTAHWRDSLEPHELPEVVLEGVEPVMLDVRPGDVIMFLGSSILHERTHGAGADLLYLKVNALRLDPFGEDPASVRQRQRSLELIAAMSDQDLLAGIVEVSPRLQRVSRHYTRLDWQEVLQAHVADEKAFPLSEADLEALKAVDRPCTVGDLLVRLGVPGPEAAERLGRIRRLIELGGFDLLS